MIKKSSGKFDGGSVFAYDFYGVADLRSFLTNTPIGSCFTENSHLETDHKFQSCLTRTWQEAEQLLDRGCPEIAEKITRYVCRSQAIERRSALCRQQAGFAPAVASWLCGDPQSMYGYKPTARKARVIDVYMTVDFGYTVAPAEIIRAQSRSLSLIRSLEQAGLAVNLWAVSAMRSEPRSKNILLHCLRLKSSTERLNILRLSYPLCHPSFLRRHIFAAIEHTPEANTTKTARNYGYVLGNSLVLKAIMVVKKNGENTIIIPATLEEEELKAILKKQNCDLAVTP